VEKHKKNYLKTFYPKWGSNDVLPCERCNNPGHDVHHIDGRWCEDCDNPEKLMLLCRGCHARYHDGVGITRKELSDIHQKFMKWRLRVNSKNTLYLKRN